MSISLQTFTSHPHHQPSSSLQSIDIAATAIHRHTVMAPKRKAGATAGRSTKRIASGVNTPVSAVSDDDFSGGSDEEYDSEERAAPRKLDSQWPRPRLSACDMALMYVYF